MRTFPLDLAPLRKGVLLTVGNVFVSLFLGAISGLSCVGVRVLYRLLQWLLLSHTGTLPAAASVLSFSLRIGIPILGAAIATLILGVQRGKKQKVFLEYVEAIRFNQGEIPFAPTSWRTIASAFSISSGAAVGREGSMIQFAASATAWISAKLSPGDLTLSEKVTCGVAAAVAAAYQAPVAGFFFAFEIVFGRWNRRLIAPMLTASCAGCFVSRILLGPGPLFKTSQHVSLSGLEWIIPLCLVAACCAPFYQWLLRSAVLLKRLPLPLLWGGLCVGFLSTIRPEVWGNGDVALATILSGSWAFESVLSILLLRTLATTVCVGVGTVGGVFTPTLFFGAALGFAYAHLLAVSNSLLFTISGMSAFLAVVTSAPCMAAVMAVELSGQWHLLWLLLPLNIMAKTIERHISSRSLFALASPDPSAEIEA